MTSCRLGGCSVREKITGQQFRDAVDRMIGNPSQHRPWQLYRTVFEELVGICQAEARDKQRKFRFRHPLLSLGYTVIPVCAFMFDWAKYRKTKGAVKVHTVLDNRSVLPQYAVISDGKRAYVKMARTLKFEAGTILVMDRGYEDHDWWRKLAADGVFFVSRLKDSTAYVIFEERPQLAEPILR